MIEVCVNSYYIDKHLEEQEKGEVCMDNFFDDIEEYLGQIEDLVTKIKECESCYEGYDLEQYKKELIGEVTK